MEKRQRFWLVVFAGVISTVIGGVTLYYLGFSDINIQERIRDKGKFSKLIESKVKELFSRHKVCLKFFESAVFNKFGVTNLQTREDVVDDRRGKPMKYLLKEFEQRDYLTFQHSVKPIVGSLKMGIYTITLTDKGIRNLNADGTGLCMGGYKYRINYVGVPSDLDGSRVVDIGYDLMPIGWAYELNGRILLQAQGIISPSGRKLSGRKLRLKETIDGWRIDFDTLGFTPNLVDRPRDS